MNDPVKSCLKLIVRLGELRLRALRRKFLPQITMCLAIGASGDPVPAFANHSEVMFNANERVRLAGTVKSIKWANPHGLLLLEVNSIDTAFLNTTILWTIETGPPNSLGAQGWTKESVKSGDTLSIDISPARSGKNVGYARKLTQVNGKPFQP